MKIITLIILSSLSIIQVAQAQVAARLLEAFGDSCPITQGGMGNPLNQARNSITTSAALLNQIRDDRDGSNCNTALTAARSSMNAVSPQSSAPTDGAGGGDGKAPPAGGNVGNPGNGGNGGTPGPTVGGSGYQRAFDALLAEDRLSELESRKAALQREADNPATTAERRMTIENDIARLQQEINTIQIDERASATRARLTVGQHINTAANSILTAIRQCQSAPSIIAQLAPAALDIASAMGAIGGAAALGLDVVANLVNSIFVFFRDQDIRGTHSALADATQPTAVRCAYLTIGQQYCQTVEQRRSFLTGAQNPMEILNQDPEGRCSLSGMTLMGENIREHGGLASELLNITQRLRDLGTPNFHETDVDRLLYGHGGSQGLLERVQNIDNYYDYVERMANSERANYLGMATRAGATTAQGREYAESARRLRAITADVHARRQQTRELRAGLETYRNNTQNNTDPYASNTAHLEALRSSLSGLMTTEGSERSFEGALTEITDIHREALGLKWSRELAAIPPTLGSGNTSEILLRRRRLLDRFRALTSASQSESMRLASIGITELSAVAIRHRRETMGSAVDTQLQNLQAMGNFLAPHLEQSITQLTSRIQSAGTDPSAGPMRERLLGLCESTLTLQSSRITQAMKNGCNDIIYRNEGNQNITFRAMYARIARGGGAWSTEYACHPFNNPDNVSRDR
ncbi:MAG: hypothetical protein A2X86_16185 [Bdellovibrionales bacterium GWA2_49_15]|nr:MAG: hypothetical protein A2X86_16185 [Bdellovibrionales bacterium GWA2_49_15]HAZ13645.1 hypothetical protein [Bdellovibrionales bacterium]